jgi:hypothetical protein
MLGMTPGEERTWEFVFPQDWHVELWRGQAAQAKIQLKELFSYILPEVRACVHACVRACVHACIRACVWWWCGWGVACMCVCCGSLRARACMTPLHAAMHCSTVHAPPTRLSRHTSRTSRTLRTSHTSHTHDTSHTHHTSQFNDEFVKQHYPQFESAADLLTNLVSTTSLARMKDVEAQIQDAILTQVSV